MEYCLLFKKKHTYTYTYIPTYITHTYTKTKLHAHNIQGLKVTMIDSDAETLGVPKKIILNPRTQTLGDFHPTHCYPREYCMGSFSRGTILPIASEHHRVNIVY